MLVLCKMLRLSVNTLTADDKYSLLNRNNLTQPIHMELCQKLKASSQRFLHFPNLHLQHFHNKDDPHS